MPDRLLSRDEVLAALRGVGHKLHRQGSTAELYIFGGGCMVLAFQSRLVTRDIDAVYEPDTEVHAAALEVAREMGLPDYWLNNQATVYLSALPDDGRQLVLDEPGIRAYTASPEFAFAMKVRAGRRIDDEEDIRFLAALLGITSTAHALSVSARVYPDEPVKPHARALLEDIFGDAEPDSNAG